MGWRAGRGRVGVHAPRAHGTGGGEIAANAGGGPSEATLPGRLWMIAAEEVCPESVLILVYGVGDVGRHAAEVALCIVLLAIEAHDY